MVPAVPVVPDLVGGRGRRGARPTRERRAHAVHTRRPARDARRLPRDPARGGGADSGTRVVRAARARPVADAHGRVPRRRRDDVAQSRGRTRAGIRLRKCDARRLPAGHVRSRRADAADPPSRRNRDGGRLAGRSLGDRLPPVRVGRPGRLCRRRRVPAGWVRERGLPIRCPGRAAARAVRGALPPVVPRRRHARHGRHRPHAAHARLHGAHSGGSRRGDARGVPRRRIRQRVWRTGTASCARVRARTCCRASSPPEST